MITSDIICLTEIQLQPSAEPQKVLSLQEFEMVYNTNVDKFQSIKIFFRNTIDTISHTKMKDASYKTFKYLNCGDKSFKLLLLHKKNVTPVTIFCNWLEELVNSISFDIIFGDFNTNVFDEKCKSHTSIVYL